MRIHIKIVTVNLRYTGSYYMPMITQSITSNLPMLLLCQHPFCFDNEVIKSELLSREEVGYIITNYKGKGVYHTDGREREGESNRCRHTTPIKHVALWNHEKTELCKQQNQQQQLQQD